MKCRNSKAAGRRWGQAPSRRLNRSFSGQRGFSLTGLLAVLAIGGVVLGQGVPLLEQGISNEHVTSATNLLVGQLNLARHESMMRRTPVSVCSSVDGFGCSGLKDWSKGWVLFSDRNRNLQIDEADEVVRVQGHLQEGLRLTASYASFVYLPDGSVDKPSVTR